MSCMPTEPEAFAEQVAEMLRRLKPDFDVALIGPRELVVNGRRLDLENLIRLVATSPDRGTEIVEQYLEHLFDEESLSAASMSWDLARPRVMPRIQPVSIFEHLSEELVAHVPYVNDTVVVFVLDLPYMTISITTEQMIRWGLTVDELEAVSRLNLKRFSPALEIRPVDTNEGGHALLLSNQDGYDASRLLLDSLFDRLAPEMGGDFLVATPSRDMFLAVTPEPPALVERVRARADQDYRRLPYPITPRLFYVTRDGVAGTDPPTNLAA